jgi:Family of unknown function (DUF5947)
VAMVERNSTKPFSALQRFARARPPLEAAQAAQQGGRQATQEQCELCGEPIPPEHRHLAEVSRREIKCVCQACSILFSRREASIGRYVLVPDRYVYFEDFHLDDAQWEGLRIPVGLAFFFRSTPAGRCVAFYPSPMGPTESLLELSTWEELEQNNPPLREMQWDVEALLVNRARGAHEYFLVPIDECYRLVGLIRMHWKGLSGGQDVWQEIAGFFAALRQRSVTMKLVGEV